MTYPTWTLTIDARELDGSQRTGDLLYIGAIDSDRSRVTITTDADGVVFDAYQRGFAATGGDGVWSIDLPAPDAGTHPAEFGFLVRVGKVGHWTVVPAQTANSTHALSEFVENTSDIPVNPADQARITALEVGLAAEVVRAEGAESSEATARANADANLQPLDTDLTTISTLDSTQSGVIASDGSGWLRKTYAQLKTALGLTKADVGLSAVDNTSDLAKPISNATATALAAKADLVGGTVPANQLPSFVDDVLEFANLAAFPATGEAGKIYVALDTNLTYRWSGSAYGVLDPSLALGSTSTTAGRGDHTEAAYAHIATTTAAHAASAISTTPAGNLAATTVQGALAELDGEKASVVDLTDEATARADADDLKLNITDATTTYVTATITGDPADPDVTLYLNGVEL